MKEIICTAILSMIVSVCFAGQEDAYNRTTDIKKIAWMDKGMEAVRAKLKDPKSAEFRSVYFHRGIDGGPVTCGEVNSKNSLGGYGGFQRFVSAGNIALTALQEEVEDFHNLWSRLCR